MLAFATNGALPATMLARYAEVKDLLHLDAGQFGVVVVASAIGATLAFQLPGVILRRCGTRWTATGGTLWIALALLLAAIGVAQGSPLLFMAGLGLAGFGDATVDVAQNAQGLRVQDAYGRSLLSSMHAGWSVGAAIGGVVGTAAAVAGVPLMVHLGVWGAVCVTVMASSAAFFLPDARGETPESGPGATLGWRTARVLAPLALVALAGISVEDIGGNWSAILLATERGVPASAAGIGLSVLLGAQFAGRLLGDRFIDAVGQRQALIASLSCVIAGLIAAAWLPWVPGVLLGLALAGLGSAVTVPIAFAQADAVPGLQQHSGVTWIAWTMRVGGIALSPAVGAITTVASLPIAISAISLLTIGALLSQVRRARTLSIAR